MVMVKISEMYDMSTITDRLGVIGIHTPTISQVFRRWHGLAENFRFMRLVKCNVRIACASVLPADPLQVGVQGPNAIAPQDLMNPILYKAVTNESWDALIGRLYASSGATINMNSVKSFPDAFPSLSADECERLYYTLLSSSEWRKVMPQQGVTVNGLKPLCYPVMTQFGQGESPINQYGLIGSTVVASTPAGNSVGVTNPTEGVAQQDNIRYFRGKARPMPRFPTATSITVGAGTTNVGDTVTLNVRANSGASGTTVAWPRTYCLAVVMPPAKLKNFYYRMIVDWYIDFSGLCTTLSRASAGEMSVDSQYNYIRSYDFLEASAKLSDAVTDTDGEVTSDTSVDSIGVDPVLQMER